jgi:tripartite ATP-independent transporter DctM subunit
VHEHLKELKKQNNFKKEIKVSIELIALVVLGSLFILLFSGLPVAFSLMSCALIFTVFFWSPSALYVASTAIISNLTKDLYLAVPMFVFMALLLERSGIAEDLFDVIYKLFPEVPAGLAVGTVFMCALVDAMSGLGGTAVITIGVLALPEMRKRGYDKRIYLGCIPAGGSLGPLIPPSVLMILIGGMMGTSVGKLFACGMIPGVLCAFLFMVYLVIRNLIQPSLAPSLPINERLPWRARVVALKGIILPVILVIIVLGSIYTGAATPTEGASVGAVGAALCGIVKRRLNFTELKEATIGSLKINCMVLWLLIGGSMFASMMSATGISALLVSYLPGPKDPMLTVIYMQIIPFIMGMFMDGAAITVICIPIFGPLILSMGVDPYWFGTLFCISLITGYLTPPFGMNLFYTKGIAPPDITMGDLYKSVTPYIIIEVGVICLVYIFPSLALWLPSLMD